MVTSKKGIAFIASFEGFASKPYRDSAGIPTIGYGFTYYPNGKKVTMQDKPITKAEALEIKAKILPNYEKIVNKKVKVPLTQNQFDALVSHTYNTGGSDTLFKLINERASKTAIRNWFEQKYITAGGKKLNGLVRRRKAEADLYFS